MTYDQQPEDLKDTITDIKLFNSEIYVSSIDKTINIHENFKLTKKIEHFAPITKMLQFDGEMIFSDTDGGICTSKKYFKTDCGGIQGLCAYKNSIITGGWNKKVQILQNDEIVQTIDIKNKVYDMDLYENTLLIGCDSSFYQFIDLRKFDVIIRKEVKNPISTVSLKDCAAIGTSKGEIKIDFDFFSNSSKSFYTFVAHREDIGLDRVSYPVKSIILNETLFSGGHDGKIIEFDYKSKRKLREVIHHDYPVSKLADYGDSLIVGFNSENEDQNRTQIRKIRK